MDIAKLLTDLRHLAKMRLVPKDAPAEFLTSAEVAVRLGKSQRTVLRWANDGRLPVAGLANGTRLFRVRDVDHVAAAEVARLEAAAAELKVAAS